MEHTNSIIKKTLDDLEDQRNDALALVKKLDEAIKFFSRPITVGTADEAESELPEAKQSTITGETTGFEGLNHVEAAVEFLRQTAPKKYQSRELADGLAEAGYIIKAKVPYQSIHRALLIAVREGDSRITMTKVGRKTLWQYRQPSTADEDGNS